MVTLNHVLLLLAAGAGRVLLLLVSPVRKCSWCKNTRRAKKHRYWGRVGGCRKCKVTGKHYRLGATTVHKVRQLIRDDIKERRSK